MHSRKEDECSDFTHIETIIHSFNDLLFAGRVSVWRVNSLACNALRLMGAQLRPRLIACAPQCVHIWASDRGFPRKLRNRAKSEYTT